MGLRVYRSQNDPSLHIITDDEHFMLALEEHRASDPSDLLRRISQDEAESVLASIPDLCVVDCVIDFAGYFAYTLDDMAPVHVQHESLSTPFKKFTGTG